jgi:hypothetical protein
MTREGRARGDARFTKTTLHNLLTNAVYIGRVKFEGKLHDGEHERVIDDDTWNRVQDQLNRNGRRGGRNPRNKLGGRLKGLVRCGSCGSNMIHTNTKKRETLYRYYACANERFHRGVRGFSQRCARRPGRCYDPGAPAVEYGSKSAGVHSTADDRDQPDMKASFHTCPASSAVWRRQTIKCLGRRRNWPYCEQH